MMTKIREGYKETEIGVIPEDWEVARIIDLADKSDRYSFTGGPFGSDLKSSDYTIDGIRVIQLQNIGDGKFYNDSKVYTSVNKANELSNSNIFPNELILAKMADPVARACKIPDFHDRYVMCSDGIRLKVNPMKYDTAYCLYSINSAYFRKKAIENSTGTTRLRIGLTALKELEIATPSLLEQQRIAEILSTTDGHIEKLDKTIEDFQLLKKGMMKKLLTEGIGHTEFKDTEIGRIPEEWEVVELGSFTEFTNGYAFNSKKYSESGKAIIRMSNISIEGLLQINEDNVRYCTIETYNELQNFWLYEDDLVICMTDVTPEKNIIGRTAVIDESDKYILNQRVGKVKVLDSEYCDYNYLHYYTNSEVYLKRIRDTSGGSAQSNASTKEILKSPIPIPRISEQNQITEVLIELDRRIEAYRVESDDFKLLKKSLMEKLLTGKIRVI